MENVEVRSEYHTQLPEGFSVGAVDTAMLFVALAPIFRKLTRLDRLLYLGRLGKFKYWKKLKKYLKKIAKPVQNMINYRQSYYQRPELELLHTKPLPECKFLTKGMKLELDHDLDNIETVEDRLIYLNHYKLKDNGDKILEEYEDANYRADVNDEYEDPDPGSSSGFDSESDKDLDEAEEGLIKEIRPK
jgi:hypothetical protein